MLSVLMLLVIMIMVVFMPCRLPCSAATAIIVIVSILSMPCDSCHVNEVLCAVALYLIR